MNVFCQGIPVIEVIIAVNDMIRTHALVHIVIGTVFHKRDTLCAGQPETGSPSGCQIPDNTAAAAGNLAQQSDASVFLEGPWHQVSTGERRGGDKAVQVQAATCQSIIFIKLSVQIHICVVEQSGLRIGEGVMDGKMSVAKEPAEEISSCRSLAAAIAAQVDHHVFDGTVFPGNLPVRIDDAADGVHRHLLAALIQRVIIHISSPLGVSRNSSKEI